LHKKDEQKSREELIAEIQSLRIENRQFKKKSMGIHSGQEGRSNKTILIVDDNDDTRETVVAMIESFGYSAIEADSPHGAVELFLRQKASIDLILSDIVMPDGGGQELVHNLMTLKPDLKVIFMSGYAEDEMVHHDVFKVQKSRAQFIRKPFTMEEIGSLLEQQLGK
jgi:two-component system, cell cycle sensor histidine kinase and response regulator CckA